MSAHAGYQPRGMYFEDFEIEKSIVTSRRTVTLTDIVNFACLSGDHNAPHVDHEFCKTQPYGEPLAHGPLVLAIVGGLQCLTGINDGTIVAMLGLDAWRMHLPVKAGDTIHAVITPKEKKPTSSGKQGIVIFDRIVKNQRDEVVQSMVLSLMYKCRPTQAA
ncbi:MaoC/PaaZ C-terminal domain-containing protein [Comamonas aquatica]|uniref:MaoC/PaaZ C-terminal domain-containing protein n=1 Tax=Comamonas aquatica TaxID=225991 RepID=UPI00244C7877|nr:MaoC/PaaZ C-terminal domain-containing protein [Comamonas aquatica]MDH1675983.1 MaoC/PaaZ C-terminal domain-containing protein [Comamonas aquatica]MDH1679637.1 MaoC/PaaZ C-terminal domain-containing protein [Comamonas aquatica]